MLEKHIKQVTVIHGPLWGKWPDTDDLDYTDILAERTELRYTVDDVVYIIENRFYPAYLAFIECNWLSLPIAFPWINNTVEPSPYIMARQIADLEDISHECDVIIWDHARNCYPRVADQLQRMFLLSILPFADDCPGSSDTKTFPVARNFDAVLHFLKVYNLATGEMIPDKYKALGVPRTYFKSCNPTNGIPEVLKERGFDVERKARNIQNGLMPETDFCFVGYQGWDGHRKEHCFDLNMTLFHSYGISSRIHGMGMRDGELVGFNTPNAGRNVADVYINSLCSANPQVSSLFNSRLMDLWISGVVQFCYDPWGELESEGFYPHQHFIPYDGTIPGLIDGILEIKADPRRAGEIILEAYEAATKYLARNSIDSVYGRIYHDHRERFI